MNNQNFKNLPTTKSTIKKKKKFANIFLGLSYNVYKEKMFKIEKKMTLLLLLLPDICRFYTG